MTCGMGIRTRVGNCTQPSTEECSDASCMANEHVSVGVVDGSLACDICV